MEKEPNLISDNLRNQMILASVLSAETTFSSPDFADKWASQDRLVGKPGVERPFTWGPGVPGAPVELFEPYLNSPGGRRRVQYFDKARMEINIPASGFVTSGLAVKELVSGQRQDGDNVFTAFPPSQTQVAGDAVSVNPNAPVYASFKDLVTLGNADSKSKPNATGQPINQLLSKDGSLKTITPPEAITVGAYESQTGHNIAAPFQAFKNIRGTITDPATGAAQPDQPVYTANPTSNVFGLAISEPYWVNTKIAGQDRVVLVQLFERRVLTYNPALPGSPVQKVEMGNLGQHYYQWRYIENGVPAVPSGIANITIENFGFNPPVATIPAGTKVIWTNRDEDAHTVTKDDGPFKSGTLKKDATFEFVFLRPGIYDYHCIPHPEMKGTVVVK